MSAAQVAPWDFDLVGSPAGPAVVFWAARYALLAMWWMSISLTVVHSRRVGRWPIPSISVRFECAMSLANASP